MRPFRAESALSLPWKRLTNMHENPARLRYRDVRQRFDRAATSFDEADFLHRLTFDGLIARLAPIAATPQTVLDLGSATGTGSRLLARQFPRAKIISADISLPMLLRARKKKSWLGRFSGLQADARHLPLCSGSIDLVFANLLLPWIDDLAAVFAEIARVMRKDGVFAFSTLGPDSLDELRAAWRTLDRDWHVNACLDMHDIGDGIVRAGLRDPVLDVDKHAVSYADTAALYRDLTRCGARNCLALRRKTLTGKKRFADMELALAERSTGGPLTIGLELVYGHAWGGGPRQNPAEFHLDPAAIGRRRR
jgi:malonyl-CoA O-methyltransferase